MVIPTPQSTAATTPAIPTKIPPTFIANSAALFVLVAPAAEFVGDPLPPVTSALDPDPAAPVGTVAPEVAAGAENAEGVLEGNWVA